MQIFSVGGAVRDELLGLPVQDRDYVVVGATPEQMNALGYKPVGKDFPVFLHPQTHAEYALARTERKTAPGYKGFAFHAAPDVTLAPDLARRDLTSTAIALYRPGSKSCIRPETVVTVRWRIVGLDRGASTASRSRSMSWWWKSSAVPSMAA